MTDEEKAAEAAAAAEKEKQEQEGDKGKVAYETYSKVLAEKKALQAKFAEQEKAAKLADEDKKKKNEEYKSLLEEREKELAETNAKLAQRDKEATDARKMNAFLKQVQGEVPTQYWGLIDLDAISVGEDGKADEMSVKKVAKDFEKTFHHVIVRKNGNNMPNNAAGGGGAKLSRKDWEALPLDEMKKRAKDVDWES